MSMLADAVMDQLREQAAHQPTVDDFERLCGKAQYTRAMTAVGTLNEQIERAATAVVYDWTIRQSRRNPHMGIA